MPTYPQLNAADQVSGSDLLALWSQANGDARKISLTNFLNWMATQQVATQDNKVTQYAAPLTGTTLTVLDNDVSVWLILTPAGTIAALTLLLPNAASVPDKTEILINTTQTITSLLYSLNGGSTVGAPTTLAANGFFRLRFDAVLKTWYRVG